MALVKKPVNGMKDILPAEKELRDYCLNIIRDTYASYGFTPMETPVVESLANLTSRQGGDNEKLIFRILKRGEKLKINEAQDENDLADSGLRYDLTVPLVRYYSAHKEELLSPFKAFQNGYVFRADRPQRGRFRQFMQCDIDILGEAGPIAEIELITATCEALTRLSFKDFIVRISDRRILKAMALAAGFMEERQGDVFITLDKMDKIGLEGVREELLTMDEDAGKTDRLLSFVQMTKDTEETAAAEVLKRLQEALGDHLEEGVTDSLISIIESVEALKSDAYRIVCDLTLVRGMGYYTGTIFEVSMPEFGGSCGGGGRYDRMVGSFTGTDVPAVGFSIGFERIVMLLAEKGFTIPLVPEKCCYLIEKGVEDERLRDILRQAQSERAAGKRILVARMNKNRKFQKEQLSAAGYTEFKEFFREALRT